MKKKTVEGYDFYTDNFNFFVKSDTSKKLGGQEWQKVDMSHEFVSLKQSDCQMSNMD